MPVRYMQVEESLGEAGGFDACARLLTQYPDTDALCVPVDAFAVGALAAVQQAGLRVPQDVMIATRYDGLRARTAEPALTAVDRRTIWRAATTLVRMSDNLNCRAWNWSRCLPNWRRSCIY